MASLKEGSQYEEVALVTHLHGLVTSCFDMRLQVKDVVTALVYFDLEKDALILQVGLHFGFMFPFAEFAMHYRNFILGCVRNSPQGYERQHKDDMVSRASIRNCCRNHSLSTTWTCTATHWN